MKNEEEECVALAVARGFALVLGPMKPWLELQSKSITTSCYFCTYFTYYRHQCYSRCFGVAKAKVFLHRERESGCFEPASL